MIQEETTKRLICFGADGASIFQGCHTGMTFQLKEIFFPYMMGQHCMAHQTNLAIQVLLNLPMVAKLEDLLSSQCFYFYSSPKRYLKFIKLVEIVETRRLKFL